MLFYFFEYWVHFIQVLFFLSRSLERQKEEKSFTACWPVLDTPHECSKALPIIRHPTAHLVEFTPHAQMLCSLGSILQAISCLSPPGALSFTFLSSSCNHLIKALSKSFLKKWKHRFLYMCRCIAAAAVFQSLTGAKFLPELHFEEDLHIIPWRIRSMYFQ